MRRDSSPGLIKRGTVPGHQRQVLAVLAAKERLRATPRFPRRPRGAARGELAGRDGGTALQPNGEASSIKLRPAKLLFFAVRVASQDSRDLRMHTPDPILAIVTATAGIVTIGTGLWGWRSIRTGRLKIYKTGMAIGLETIDRRERPKYYWFRLLFGPIVLFSVSAGWFALLLPDTIEGKRLHSRFRDGTAVFDNEGIHCDGDPPGYTHYHSCAGPPVLIPD
jgi:hypothetical protein